MNKKTNFSLILFLISIISYAQITFENGYYIDKNNNKIDCQIKNYEWKNNPSELEINENGNKKIVKIDNINEFKVGNLHYIKKTVEIDKMEDILDYDINNNSEPIFTTETLLLKVLLEGDINLYSYAKDNLLKFFYETKEHETKQFIYKIYMIDDNKASKNTQYKKQLSDLLKGSPYENETKYVEYSSTSLTKILKKYNIFKGATYEKEKNEFSENFYFTAKIGFSSSSVNTNAVFGPTAYNSKINFPRVGIEAEYYFPINKKTWSLITGLDFNQYSNSTTDDFTNYNENSKVNLKITSLEFSIGTRYYFYFTKNLKMYVNATYSPEFILNSKSSVEYSNNPSLNYEDKLKSQFSGLGYGIGFKYKEKFLIDIKKIDREFKGDTYAISHQFNMLAVNFGYSF